MIQYSGDRNQFDSETSDADTNYTDVKVSVTNESGINDEDFNVDFADALVTGLATDAKSIPCRFLYDKRGSELFEHITDLHEYYPTRTETSILRGFSAEFARAAGAEVALVEFGSGSSTKTELLLDSLGSKAKVYVAVEISQAALDAALNRIQDRFPELSTVGICDDFNRGITLPANIKQHSLVGFFPGSTIGNLERTESIQLLIAMRETLGDQATLIVGTDLVKSPDLLIPAYDDARGVTAEFTRNILLHANYAVGTDFCVDAFQHQVIWNESQQRIEIYLISLHEQSVNFLGRTIKLHRRERIHIENSHKYTIEGFRALAKHAGWKTKDIWTDQHEWFAVHELAAN